MVEEKQDDILNDIDLPEESYDDPYSEDLGLMGSGNSETIAEKPTIDKFYDTENILYSIEKTFRGYQKQKDKWVYVAKPIARDEFINLTINSLRSVINPENIISKKDAEEVEVILWEKNQEFIDLCEDEITLDEDHFETIINIYDHSLELFMGLVQGGHGSQTLKEIYAGIARDLDNIHEKREDSTFRLAVGERDVVNIGMRK